MKHVQFYPLAERELADAIKYYDEQRPGLGAEFLEGVAACGDLPGKVSGGCTAGWWGHSSLRATEVPLLAPVLTDGQRTYPDLDGGARQAEPRVLGRAQVTDHVDADPELWRYTVLPNAKAQRREGAKGADPGELLNAEAQRRRGGKVRFAHDCRRDCRKWTQIGLGMNGRWAVCSPVPHNSHERRQ